MWLFLQSVVIIRISLLPVISVNTCAYADHRGLIVNRWLETYSRYLQPLDTAVDIKIFHAEIDILSKLKQLFPISCNVMKTHYTSLWTWFSEHRFIEISRDPDISVAAVSASVTRRVTQCDSWHVTVVTWRQCARWWVETMPHYLLVTARWIVRHYIDI